MKPPRRGKPSNGGNDNGTDYEGPLIERSLRSFFQRHKVPSNAFLGTCIIKVGRRRIVQSGVTEELCAAAASSVGGSYEFTSAQRR